MESRVLGRTGARLSVVGFGGMVAAGMEQRDAEALVDEALEAGITYVDVAPTYGDCEERIGPALYGKRDRVFLACKTTERTKDGSRAELERSLERLKTDHFDVYQLHGVAKLEDVEKIFGPNGAMETFLRAKEEGKTRFLGFSAHSEEAALALMDRFDFDTMLFPTNWVCWFKGNFGPRALERARARNMGMLALKAMARQKWPEGANKQRYPKCWYQPEDEREIASLALRFAWSQGITACVPPGDPGMWRMAVSLADNTRPLTDEETAFLRERAQGLEPIFRVG
jgi:predicted aldo/keto reductase-like oxidoreductase